MSPQTSSCPGCGGRGIISNSKTGSPEPCPICDAGTNDLPFWYFIAPPGSNSVVIALANGVAQATVTIDNDYDFVCDRLIANSTGLYSAYIIDKYRTQPFSPSQAVPVNGENLAGTAQLPFWLPRRVVFPKQSSISAYFTDRSGNPNNTIQFCLVGYKDVDSASSK